MNLLVWYRSLMRSVGATLVKLIVTATSGLVSFTTNVIRPVKVTCEFSPVQEGTGDPSPDNVRSISGWTGCKITHTHGNLIDPSTSTFGYYINNSGQYVASAVTPKLNASDFFRVVPGHQYTMHMENQSGATNKIVFCWYSSDKRFLGRGTLSKVDNHPYYTLTQVAPSDAYYGRANYFTSNLQTALIYDSTELIEAPDSQVVALPITFTDPSIGDPLTVYGGTVTLNEDGSVDLVSDRAIITMNGTGLSSGGVSFVGKGSRKTADEFYTRINGKTSSSGELFFGNVCSHGPEAPTGEADGLGIVYFRTYAPAKQKYHEPRLVFPHSMGIDTIEKANAWLAAQANNGTPVKYTYYIKNLITYHFPNVGQLKAFLGTNNIWHDMNGSITAEYWNKQ